MIQNVVSEFVQYLLVKPRTQRANMQIYLHSLPSLVKLKLLNTIRIRANCPTQSRKSVWCSKRKIHIRNTVLFTCIQAKHRTPVVFVYTPIHTNSIHMLHFLVGIRLFFIFLKSAFDNVGKQIPYSSKNWPQPTTHHFKSVANE